MEAGGKITHVFFLAAFFALGDALILANSHGCEGASRRRWTVGRRGAARAWSYGWVFSFPFFFDMFFSFFFIRI